MIASVAELAASSEANRATARRLGVRGGVIVGLAVAVVVTLLLGLLVSWILGPIVGIVLGAVAAFLWIVPRTRGAVDVILSIVGARPADEVEFPRYANLIEGLSISSGVEEPQLFVVDDDGANLMVLGSPEGGTLVATTGLLSSLGRVELEGVLAEGLYRIRVNEAELATQAAVVIAAPVLRSGPGRPDGVRGGAATRTGRRAARLHELVPERGYLLADLSASGITRFPPGLREALVRMDAVGTTVAGATWGTAHLWMCDPLPAPSAAGVASGDTVEAQLNGWFAHHPPIQHRIDLLAEL